jgi:hypothetical protein
VTAPELTVPQRALKMAADGLPVTIDALQLACGCKRSSALTALSLLAGEGKLTRLSRGQYVIGSGDPPPRVAPDRVPNAKRDAFAVELAKAEAFLSSREPLPAARPPRWADRGRR